MSETLEQLKAKPHYSYSAINTYLAICPLQFRYRYIDRLEAEQTPVALPFGSAYHAALTEQAQAARKGELLPCDALKEIFATYFRANIESSPKVIYKDGQDEDALILLAGKMLESTTKDWPDFFTCVSGLAVPFKFEIEGLSKPVIGEYDLVLTEMTPFDEPGDPTITIVDWKTSARSWPDGREDRELQATIYTASFEANNGRRPDFRYDITTKAKAPKVERRYTKRSSDQIERMKRLLLEADRAIERGCFLPNENSFSCGDCPYAGACARWHLDESKSISVSTDKVA